MILVDTSVVIGFFKETAHPKVDLFSKVIDRNVPWGICDYVFQEVLQGARDDREFERLREYLASLPFYSLKGGPLSFEEAARINLRCRQKGVTIRSSIDLLIAQIAIENDVALLHNDRDFDAIAEVVPELRILRDLSL